MNDPAKSKDAKPGEPDPNAVVVEEKIIKVTGDFQIRKYYKGRLLGKGGFAKCYEFVCAENKKNFAARNNSFTINKNLISFDFACWNKENTIRI